MNYNNYDISIRGVSRWDTCAAQAVLEANNGILQKLFPYNIDPYEASSYKYLKSDANLDFEEDLASLTTYNSRTKVEKNMQPTKAMNVMEVKPYANLCGLIALAHNSQISEIRAAIIRTKEKVKPAFD
jgi:hypothetical protein